MRDGLDSVGRRQNSCCCWEANRSVPTPNPYPVTVPTTLSRLVYYVALFRIMEGNLTLAVSSPVCFVVNRNRNNFMFC